MNILLVSYIFYPEPIAMSAIVEDMATALAKEHNVTVLTSQPCRPLGYKLPDKLNKDSWNFKRVILPSYTHPQSGFVGRARESNSFGKAVVDYLKKHKTDVDAVYGCIQPLYGQLKVVSYCKKHDIPCTIHVEDIYPEPFLSRLPGVFGRLMFRMFLPMDKKILQNAAKVVAIGPKIREYLIKTRQLQESKVEYVYNWQDDTRFENVEVKKERNDVFTFMYVGSLSSAANLLFVANSYIKACPKGCRMVFAGNGALKPMLTEIAAKLPESIEITEARFEDVPKLQGSADVLVLPLKPTVALKAFPSKFPSYLFSKKPILAIVEKESDVAACINEASCGWIVEPTDEEALVDAFKNIPTTRQNTIVEMGTRAYEFGKKNLTKDANLSKFCSIIINAK